MTISLLLKIFLLSSSLPLLLSNPAWSQKGCTEVDIKANFNKIDPLLVFSTSPEKLQSAINPIVQCGSKSIQPMILIVKNRNENYISRIYAMAILAKTGTGSDDAIFTLIDVFKDKTEDRLVRIVAFNSLLQIKSYSSNNIKALIAIAENKEKYDDIGRIFALATLGQVGSESLDAFNTIIAIAKNKNEKSEIRRSAVGGLFLMGTQLEKNKENLHSKQLNQIIQGFTEVFELIKVDRDNIYKGVSEPDRDLYVQKIKATLDILKREQQAQWDHLFWQIFKSFSGILLFQFFSWILFIFFYPKNPWIQSTFFWNPKIRTFWSFWYVNFLLTGIPFLRSRLFLPFKESLLADAHLDMFKSHAYFPDLDVKLTDTDDYTPIQKAILEIKGQIILEGESGLGKSTFLRHLVQKAKRIPVYLPAKKCDAGVLEAIQAKLHGYVKEDPDFLKNLIYSGAIDICIDGLNEVTPDIRAKVTSFVESYFKGNIIMATQPLEWTPPSTAKTYILQPLKGEQIENFLISRKLILSEDAQVKGSDYEQACKYYLTTVLNAAIPEEEIATRRMLSNPMELTVVALMLSQGKTPDLLNLQQQQFDIMKDDYERLYPAKTFPLKAFSETVYQMRLNDRAEIPPEEWKEELQCMERHKMVISRQVTDSEGKSKTEWYFRHDKIQDFFIVQTFFGEPKDNRLVDHISDPRFRGVYFLLARLMPVEEAKVLRETLINYAADTKDHTVSDTFIQLFRSRQPT